MVAKNVFSQVQLRRIIGTQGSEIIDQPSIAKRTRLVHFARFCRVSTHVVFLNFFSRMSILKGSVQFKKAARSSRT
ncbi:hypothetical protein CEXT_1701 [Caerostris extrusa]|uniref:Uncharacterized protein n=1 Tax=Caerostris extrusa TaxID=172846 RepID=A0AAV4X2C3_CAEEX|nr:hypothetical protein CEXT_1701 [Caerostris extrusa]